MYSMNSLCVQGRVCDGEHLHNLWPHSDPEQGPEKRLCITYYGMMHSVNSLCVQGFVCDGEHLHDLWPHGDPDQGPEKRL